MFHQFLYFHCVTYLGIWNRKISLVYSCDSWALVFRWYNKTTFLYFHCFNYLGIWNWKISFCSCHSWALVFRWYNKTTFLYFRFFTYLGIWNWKISLVYSCVSWALAFKWCNKTTVAESIKYLLITLVYLFHYLNILNVTFHR